MPAVMADDDWLAGVAASEPLPPEPSSADDMALYQHTAETTRELLAAVRHHHRAVVTVAVAALYGTTVRPGDCFMRPSSPAWGHGLWHGALAPLSLGVNLAAYSGKFNTGAADEGTGRLAHHQSFGRRHPLSHDEAGMRAARLHVQPADAEFHRRAPGRFSG
jgi:acyl-coenzyme A synthetase/AMP-(fatty) acid ligase